MEEAILTANRLRDQGQPALAATAYRTAIELAPERWDLLVQLGNMLKDSNQPGMALEAYQTAIGLSDQADTHLQIGHVHKILGDRGRALAEYRQAVTLDPTMQSAIQELAAAGERDQQEHRFKSQFNGEPQSGLEALLTISHAVAAMRAELDRLSRMLPDAQAQAATPIGLYDVFRSLYRVPPPPSVPTATFHILLLADPTEVTTLFQQIAALRAQSFGNWTLSVMGRNPEHRSVIALAAMTDPRIRWTEIAAESTPGAAELLGMEQSEADWIMLLAEGAVLDAEALAWFAAAIAWSDGDAFITDEEERNPARGVVRHTNPAIRQVVDVDTLLQANVFGETIVIRRTILTEAANFLPQQSVTAARTALLLRMAAAGQVGHIPYPLVWRRNAAPPDPELHRQGVESYLLETGLSERVDMTRTGGSLWQPRQPGAEIAVIIPTRDNGGDVERLVQSLRGTATAPDKLDILIVDNGSQQPQTVAILARLAADPDLRVLRRDVPFNWSALNNGAVDETSAPLLLFMNDDMRMLTVGWDMQIRGLLEREDVGVVGARLLYPDDTVQHAGVLLGWKGSVIHDGLFEPAGAPGPASRWAVTRAAGAVTGAFLATRRDLFLALGGFDAAALPVAYSDIDYCMTVRQAKLRVLWTPTLTLYHDESKTRGQDHRDEWRAARNAEERATMEARWGRAMESDPGVNPIWYDATLPFRLISAPSLDRVRDHIIRTSARWPWAILPADQANAPAPPS